MGLTLATWAAVAAGVSAVGSIAGATAGVIGGVSSHNQAKQNAKAQQEAFEYNARMEQREATAEEAEANEAARRTRLENERLQSMQRAAYGKSGAAVNFGSPLAVLGDTAAMQEMEVLDTHRSGALAYNRRMAQANSFAYQGRVAGKSVHSGMLIGSIGSSISSGLQGVGNAASSGIGSYIGIKDAQTRGIIKA